MTHSTGSATTNDLATLLGEEQRRRLVRLCGLLTRSPDAAEDLAQEALLEAWRARERLHDPAG